MITLHNIDFEKSEDMDKVRNYLSDKGIPTGAKGIHFGNYCLINIPDNLITDIIENFKVWYRNKKSIIEGSDIAKFKKGDKVTIDYLLSDDSFIALRNKKGTVNEVINGGDNGEYSVMSVRGYKMKKNGWWIHAGDECTVVKGWERKTE